MQKRENTILYAYFIHVLFALQSTVQRRVRARAVPELKENTNN